MRPSDEAEKKLMSSQDKSRTAKPSPNEHLRSARVLLSGACKHISARQLALLACLALVAGAMALLIASYGVPTPIYDQWDLEAANLYKPYLEGHLSLSNLFALHNEHRMFFTRMFALALFELRGAWDPIWEMAADIIFRLLAISLLLVLLNRLISALEALAVALFCALLSAIPFTWETILMGYPSSFYFLLIFSFAAFLLFNGSIAFSMRWWIGTLFAVLAYLNVASGMFTLLAVASVNCLQMICGMRRGTPEWAGLALHSAICIFMFIGIPTLEHHAPLRAHSIAQFAYALAAITAWPLSPRYWLLLYAPAFIFAGLLVVRKPACKNGCWSYLMLLAWLALQFGALAYGRAAGPVASRYIDILVVGVVLNFAIILCLCRHVPAQGRLFAYTLASFWIVVVCIAGAKYASREIPNALSYHYSWLQIKTKNVKTFLETKDISALSGKTYPDIPYPSSTRLIQLLSDPTIQKVLPSNLVGEDSASQFVWPRTYLRGAFAHTAVRMRDWMLRNGYVFIALGFALFIVSLIRFEWGRNASPDEFVPDNLSPTTG